MADTWEDPAARARPRRRRGLPVWGIVLIVGGVLAIPVVAALAFVGLGLALVAAADQLEPTEEDRAALFTIDDFERFEDGWDHDFDPELETVTKLRWPDGTLGIEYEYEDEWVYLYSSIDVERSARDARGTYSTLASISRLAGMFEDGVRFERREDLFSWGDRSTFLVMLVDGEDGGYSAVARRGTHVVYAIWSGLVFEPDDGGGISALLEPAFARMAAHDLSDG